MKSEFEHSPEDLNRYIASDSPCIGWDPRSDGAKPSESDPKHTPDMDVLRVLQTEATVAMFNRYTRFLDDHQDANKSAQEKWEAMLLVETRQAAALERIAKAFEDVAQALTGVAQADQPNWEAKITPQAYEVVLDTSELEGVADPDHYA